MTSLALGQIAVLLSKTATAAGSSTESFTVTSESLATALAVTSIGSGTNLTINVYTSTALGQEVKVISYPAITAVTNDLTLSRADFVFPSCRIEAIYNGPVTFEVRGRGASAAVTTNGGGGGSGAVDSVNGKTGIVILTKADLGLGSVDNTGDLAKPISTATQTALDKLAKDSYYLAVVL
jgi:hypothetical protein